MDGSTLRTEIVESQKSVSDLLKWKIILIAAVGSTAFGLLKEKRDVTLELLALIPLICAYVDALVYHDGLRMMIISKFLQDMGSIDGLLSSYEKHCASHRRAFYLEITILIGTSLLLSVVIGALPMPDHGRHMLMKLSGTSGVVVMAVSRSFYEVQKDWLNPEYEYEEDGKKKKKPECWMWIEFHITLLLFVVFLSFLAVEKLHKMWLDSKFWPVPAASAEQPG